MDSGLPAWKLGYNTRHRRIRARAEHALARHKTYHILRDYRRAARTMAATGCADRHPHNIALAS